MSNARDHGGGLDAAVATFGGTRDSWLDLSTGINPVAYPVKDIAAGSWTALPDQAALDALINAARDFWNVPDNAAIIPAGGASAIIAQMPMLPALKGLSGAQIQNRTYNEHAAAFRHHGWDVRADAGDVHVLVRPNNPDGDMGLPNAAARLTIIDESFGDVCPSDSMVHRTADENTIVLKSFGKFWGLAGARLGFAIGHPETLAGLSEQLGPWAIAGPTLTLGARALSDHDWATATRQRLAADARRLDDLMTQHNAKVVGGTDLFRLYQVDDAQSWQTRLAKGHVWSRVFPYADDWLRLGLPAPDQWQQLEAAL